MQGQRRAVSGISKDFGRGWRWDGDVQTAAECGGGIGEQRNPVCVELPKIERVGQVRAAAIQLRGDGLPQPWAAARQQQHPHPPARIVKGQGIDQLGQHRQPPPLCIIDHHEQRLLLGYRRVGEGCCPELWVALHRLRDPPTPLRSSCWRRGRPARRVLPCPPGR